MFPVFLKLTGRHVLVVGEGAIADTKSAALHRAGAIVRRVTPSAFRVRDLDRVWLVVANGPPEINRRVAGAARRRQIFVNAVDDPPNATAYLGGVVRRGGVTIAISTNGDAPALSGLLREALDAVLPEDLLRWSTAARRRRRRWRATRAPLPSRRPDLLVALNRLYAGRGR